MRVCEAEAQAVELVEAWGDSREKAAALGVQKETERAGEGDLEGGGDAAGKGVVENDGGIGGFESQGEDGIWHSILTADGEGAEAVYIPAGGSREPISGEALQNRRHQITMKDGASVARHARDGFGELVARLSAESGVLVGDISFFCLHQPNLFLIRQMLVDQGIPPERAWINFPRYANTTSATIPIALSEAAAAGKLVPGAWVCLAAVGAGFAGAIQLVRWGPG